MPEAPETRPSLLLQIRDLNNRAAWESFVETYGPLVYSYAQSKGAQDADAADITQEVFRRISSAIQKFEYDPQRGMFRAWLRTITRNALINCQRKQQTGRGVGGTEVLRSLELLSEEDDNEDWEREYELQMLRHAIRRLKPEFSASHWKAFELTVFEGRKAAEIVSEVGMSLGTIYVAKSRIVARIKQFIATIDNDPLSIFDA